MCVCDVRFFFSHEQIILYQLILTSYLLSMDSEV